MRAVMLALVLVLTSMPASASEGNALQDYGVWTLRSIAVLAAGGATVAAVVLAGAVMGSARVDELRPLSPPLVPAMVAAGPHAWAAHAAVAALVGASLAVPLAIGVAILVDSVVWLHAVRPSTWRELLVAIAGQGLAVMLTLPALLVLAGIMAAVTLAYRWDADRLEGNANRQLVQSALGWAPPLLGLAVPIALAGAVLRALLLVGMTRMPTPPARESSEPSTGAPR